MNPRGVALMLTSLVILSFPGIAVNNLQNNGLISTSQAMTCTGNTCVLSSTVGCQQNSAYCSLSGNTISFLNSCSPFTNILQLNFVGFVSSFFTSCATTSSSSQFIPPGTLPPPSTTSYTFTGCTTLLTPQTPALGFIATNTYESACTILTPNIVLSNGNALTTNQGTPSNIVIGSSGTAICPGPTVWNGVIGNTTAGSTPTPTQGCFDAYYYVGSQLMNTVQFTGTCLVYGNYNGTPFGAGNTISKYVCSGLNIVTIFSSGPGVAIQTGSIIASGGLISFLLFMFGMVLLAILGLGLGGSIGGSFTILGSGPSTAAGLQTNPQGTKMAQAFGVGMLLWFPLYSEFSSWFSAAQGFFPAGLDNFIAGNVEVPGIIGTALIALFFIGVWMVSQTGTAASQ